MKLNTQKGNAMAKDQDADGLSPTVAQVLDQFFADARADGDIPDDAVDRLETLLRKGKLPKPDDIRCFGL